MFALLLKEIPYVQLYKKIYPKGAKKPTVEFIRTYMSVRVGDTFAPILLYLF